MTKLIVGSEALASGQVTRRDLTRRYTKVFRNVYVVRGVTLTAADRAEAAWLWSARTTTASGLSAAALLGSRWVPADVPAELVGSQRRMPSGIVVHQDVLADDEVGPVNGIPCTTAARTAYDLGRRLPLEEGVLRVDALLNATKAEVADVAVLARRHPGARGIRRLREVLALADPGAESPQETRVRLILVRGGLPIPETQIAIGWRRIDMGWPRWKVGIEYDGAQHWQDSRQYHGDIERLELFSELGWHIVRVVAQHVQRDPQGIVNRAWRALRANGYAEK